MQHLHAAIVLGLPLELVVVPCLLHPEVGRHDLVLQIDIDELGELQLDLHGQRVRDVHHGPHQFVVITQQVIVQALRIRIALGGGDCKEERVLISDQESCRNKVTESGRTPVASSSH